MGIFPFRATVSSAGAVTAQSTADGNETPPSEEVVTGLTQAFQASARSAEIRVTGICYDGRITQENGKKVDTVITSLEHVSGCATKTFVPYSKGFFGG